MTVQLHLHRSLSALSEKHPKVSSNLDGSTSQWAAFIYTVCLSSAAQCIVIGPVCNGRALCVCSFVGLLFWLFDSWSCDRNCVHRSSPSWVCRCSLQVMTIASWLNFSRPVPLGRGLRRARISGSALLQPECSVYCLRHSERFSFS